MADMYPMYPIILYPKWCQKWCKSDVSGCKTLKSDVKRPKSDRKWCKKALKWSESELLAYFWPFLGIKLKLFWDEGTFRVHFRVHLEYIVRVTSTNERKLWHKNDRFSRAASAVTKRLRAGHSVKHINERFSENLFFHRN